MCERDHQAGPQKTVRTNAGSDKLQSKIYSSTGDYFYYLNSPNPNISTSLTSANEVKDIIQDLKANKRKRTHRNN